MGFQITTDWKNIPEEKMEVQVNETDIFKTCKSVIEAMENGLPKEAHTMEIFEHVLKSSMEMLHCSKIKLE